MATSDLYKVMKGENIIATFDSKKNAMWCINTKTESEKEGMYILDVKGFICYQQPYETKTLQRKSTENIRGTRTIEEQRRYAYRLLHKKELQSPYSKRPQW